MLRDENRKIKDNWQEAMDKFEMIFGEKVDLERVMELLQVSNCFSEWQFLDSSALFLILELNLAKMFSYQIQILA